MKRIDLTFAVAVLGAGFVSAASPVSAQEPSVLAPHAVRVAQDVAIGWSVKKSLLGKSIYNEKEEEIGVINDLLIGPDSTISHVIVAASGKGGNEAEDLAIDASALEVHDGKFYVQVGAPNDVENAKARPPIDYAKFL
jgi:hypothetical protein